MVMRDDKCQSKLEYLNVACDEGNLNCTYIRNKVDFLVKNVSVTCTYKCFVQQSCEKRTVHVAG